MPLARLFSAFAILMSLTMFIFVNTRSFQGGTGYVFVLLALVAFAVLIVASGDIANVFLVRKSMVILFFFLFYFFVKFYFESGNGQETRELIVGTTSGVLFALGCGMAVSGALSVIHDMRQVRAVSGLISLLGLIYILISLILMIIVFQAHFGDVRGDLLLIEENRGKYQRIGDLLIMQIAMVVALGCVLITSNSRLSVIKNIPMSVAILALIALTGYTAQIIGSNKGVVATAAFAMIYLMIFLTSMMNVGDKQQIGLSKVLFGGLGFKLLVTGIAAAGIMFLFADSLIAYFNIDVSGLRITGFGGGDDQSLSSRNELFKDNFLLHFQYSPLFGNTQVELLTTGEGTYIHSVLSVLTHTGLLGGLMFFAFIVSIYQDITARKRSSDISLLANSRYGVFRLLAFIGVLVMCGFAAFFTWMPMWFTFGLVGDWFHNGRLESSRPRKRRSKRRLRTGSRQTI